MQLEKVQTISPCRELKFKAIPRVSLALPPGLQLPPPQLSWGRQPWGPGATWPQEQSLESCPLPAMALRTATRAVDKAASGQANSSQVPPSRGPWGQAEATIDRSRLLAACLLPHAGRLAMALSPSWGLCGESLTPDRHLSAAAPWPPGLCRMQGEAGPLSRGSPGG